MDSIDATQQAVREIQRLQALAETELLDSEHEAVFDAVVLLAASIFKTPMASLSLIDSDRQWFKASVGMKDRQTPREHAFCNQTIQQPQALVVENALNDQRFEQNPFVLGEPNVRFYAGVPIKYSDGSALGALCVIDPQPRAIAPTELDCLTQLGTVIERLIEARVESIRQQKALRDAERRLQLIADNMPAAISIIDQDHIYRFNNAAYSQSTGKALQDITGHPLREIHGEALYEQIRPNLERALSGEANQFELEQHAATGPRYLRGNYVPKRDESGKVIGVFGLILDQTELKLAEHKLREMAEFDALTKLANRYRLYQMIAQSAERARRTQTWRALLYLDIDKFKSINDRYGHAGGDGVLAVFANRLKSRARATDTVARLAGDEFVMLLENIHAVRDAVQVAETLLKRVAEPFEFQGKVMQIGTSIGIAVSVDPLENVDDWLHRADEALYAAKQAGRGVYRLAS